MAGRGAPLARPVWMKQAEEAKLKDEEHKAAAARAAFDATFKDFDGTLAQDPGHASSDGEDDDEDSQRLANRPVGPVDAAKCTAAGTGVGGGAAGAAASFVVLTKDSDGRRVSHGGAVIKVKIVPGVGVGGVEQEAVVKDHGDGTYTATYAVAKRGDYMVTVECNGLPILNSPFPVFFSGGNAPLANGLMPSSGAILGSSPFGSSQSFSGGLFPGMLGMIPGVMSGSTGGTILPGLAASFGEVCRDYLNGRCARADCKFNHPPQAQLMAALAAGSTMGGLSQMPMPPSAAAMAAAQSIAAAQAYQAAQAQVAFQESSASKEQEEPRSPDDKQKEALTRTLKVSNLSPLLTIDQLKTLFSYCGTVCDCQIAESKQLAYVEYAKPEEAKAALALNNMEVGGRPMNVEMSRSVSKKLSVSSAPAANSLQPPPLPVMMQQAVAMQQLQFQQALLVQQAMATQQAAARAATVKSASEMATARAAEISKSFKVEGEDQEEKDTLGARSPSRPCARSWSKSHSPIKYRRSRRSRSFSRSPIRYRRDHRSRSRSRERYRHVNHNRGRGRFYRSREDYSRLNSRRHWEQERERDYEHRSSRRRSPSISRNRSHRSRSPRGRKGHNRSPPKVRREETSSSRRLLRSRSPTKENRLHTTHNQKHVETIEMGEEPTMSPRRKNEGQASGEPSRHPKPCSKELSPRNDSINETNMSPQLRDEQARSEQLRHQKSLSEEPSTKTVSIKKVDEIMDNSGEKVVSESIMFDHDTLPMQSLADGIDAPECVKVAEDENKGEDEFKEKRRHKRRHKKEDDHEKRDKKRRKHKHRRRKSRSDSPDGILSLEGGKNKGGSGDSVLGKKGQKKKERPSRSTSPSSSASD